jgi:hypothetical protein
MRSFLSMLLLILTLAANVGLAQDNAMTIYCGECRHPNRNPDDYANHAFNQVYGPDAWMSFEQADDFFIVNSRGLKVYVDIDFIFLGIGVEGLRLPFWPENMLQITLALPNGNIVEMVRSIFLTPLPVPADAYNRDHSEWNFLPSSNGRARSGDASSDDQGSCDARSVKNDGDQQSC